MDLGRAHRRRRVPPREVRVVLLALRQRADADRGAGRRQVLALEEREQRLLRRLHFLREGSIGARFEARELLRRERTRHVAERGEQRRGGCRLCQLATNVFDCALDCSPRLREPCLDAATEVRGLAIVISGQGLEARNPGFRVCGRIERRIERRVVGSGVKAVATDEIQALLVKLEAVERELHAAEQQVAVQRVFFTERLRRQCLQAPLELLQLALASRNGRRGIVRPDARGRRVAALRGPHRILCTTERVEVGDDGLDVVGARGAGRLQGHEAPQDQEGQESLHARSPVALLNPLPRHAPG